MLVATVLALSSAFLHAGWNLFAKRSGDPFLALWSQFLVAGGIGAIALVATGGVPAGAWGWATISAFAHVPYVIALGWAYHHGDFSLAYPVARGGGAMFAAIGGVVVLGDDLNPLSVVAICVVVGGMWLLAVGADRAHVAAALVVAASIGAYTMSDSHAAREYESNVYVFASITATAVVVSVVAVAMGRWRGLVALGPAAWRRSALGGAMTVAAYGLVLVAVRRAPVGYVAALRESSVLIAVFAGARYLNEGRARVRAAAAGLIVAGLVLLVVSR